MDGKDENPGYCREMVMWHGMAWYGIVWYGMVWYDIIAGKW